MVSFSLGGKNKGAKVAAAIPAFSEPVEDSTAERVLSPEESHKHAQELQVRASSAPCFLLP